MKRVKCVRKVLGILMALTLVLGMGVTAFATNQGTTTNVATPEDGFTITLTKVESDTHHYSAYRIFKGDLADETVTENGQSVTKKVLSNIEWGDGINGAELLGKLIAPASEGTEAITIKAFTWKGQTHKDITFADALDLVKDETPADDLTAADVARVLSLVSAEDVVNFADIANEYLATAAGTSSIVKGDTAPYTYTISGLQPGYYLVQDTVSEGADEEAYSRNILQVVGDVSAEVKSEVPTIDKKILEGDQKVEANNAGVGKVVSYEITGEVPDTTGYDKYFYVINDKLSDGLTFNEGSIKVFIGEEEIEDLDGAGIYIYYGEDAEYNGRPYTFQVAFDDFTDYTKGTPIVVQYSATVNSSAVIGDPGNPNDANLIYSNNPNHNYDGDTEPGKPGIPTKDSPNGQTPDVRTITYVAQVELDKVDGATGSALPGATFTLTGTSYQTIVEGGTYYDVDPTGSYWLLKNGTYTDEAPRTEPTAVPDEKGGYVESEEPQGDYEKNEYVLIGEQWYHVLQDGDTATGTLYKILVPNDDDYESVLVKYSQKTKDQVISKDPTEVSMTVTSGDDGKVIFKGLGEGTYKIVETGVPAGYNKAADIELEIVCTITGSVKEKSIQVIWKTGDKTTKETFTVDNNGNIVGGIYAATVQNFSGSLLPSTGGIGTTIFYVAGGFLVLAAVVLLVAKKRMSGAES